MPRRHNSDRSQGQDQAPANPSTPPHPNSAEPPQTPPHRPLLACVYRQGPTQVWVALCRPVDPHDPRHWALLLQSPTRRGTVHQVGDDVGGVGYFLERPRALTRPERSSRCERRIFCGRIPAQYSITDIRRLIQHHPVDHNSELCNCRRWVEDFSREVFGLLGACRARRSRRRLRRFAQHYQ